VPLLALSLSLTLAPCACSYACFYPVLACTKPCLITFMLQHKFSAKPQPHLRQTPARSEDKTAATTTSTTVAAYLPAA